MRECHCYPNVKYIGSPLRNADLITEWFTGGGTGGAASNGAETLDTNLRSIPAEISDLKNAQPLNQKFRTNPKVFYVNFEEYPYMGTKLFA